MNTRRLAARGSGALVLAIVAAAVAAGCGGDVATARPSDTAAAPARSSGPPDPSAAAQDASLGAWRRSPIQPTPAFTAAAEAACRESPDVGDRPLAVLDARGEGRATLVFDDGTAPAVCRVRLGGDGSASATAKTLAQAPAATPPPGGALGAWDLELVEDGASAYTVLVGRVGDGVDHVAVNFDADAAWYRAAMANGWYAIWWPGAAKALGVAASDMRSVVIDSFAP